jgi:hypothetical protein
MGLIHYVHHDADGNILDSGICSEATLKKKKRNGALVIKGRGDSRLDKVVDGKIARKSKEEQEPPVVVTENIEPIKRVTVKEWDELLKRITSLENK